MEKKKADATLCLLVGGDYATYIHSFEALGIEKRQIEDELILSDADKEYGYFVDDVRVEFAIGVMYGCDSRIADYFRKLSDCVILFEKDISQAKAYNELFRSCKTDWVCVLQPNVFVKRLWLTDLIFYAENIAKTGAVSISDYLSECKFLPMLCTEDELTINVFIPDSNTLDPRGITLFTRQNLYFVGAFTEESDLKDCEIQHWQLRALNVGLTNYYIPTHTCLISSTSPVRECDVMEKSIKEMKKKRNYYIPL